MQGLEACEHFNFPYIQREVKTRTLHTPKGSAPREFQSCLKRTPVPRGWIGHPPSEASIAPRREVGG
jgi:hypothetical protein